MQGDSFQTQRWSVLKSSHFWAASSQDCFSNISYSRNDQIFMYEWYVLRIQIFSIYWALYLLRFDHPVINQNWKVSFSWIFESPSKISFPKSYNRVYTKDYSNSWEYEYLTFPTRAQSLEHKPSQGSPVPSVCSGATRRAEKHLLVCFFLQAAPHPQSSPCSTQTRAETGPVTVFMGTHMLS